MKYFLLFLSLTSYQTLSIADIIKAGEQSPLYVGLKFGSGSSSLNSVRPPIANVVSTSLDDSTSSKGFFIGARIFEFSRPGIYLATELSSSDHGKMSIYTSTATSSFFATQTIKSTDLEFIFAKTIRKNLALRFGIGVYLPSISINTDIVNLQPSNPGLAVVSPDDSGQLFSIGIEASLIENMSVVASYTTYNDIAYDFELLASRKTDLNVISLSVAFLF